MTTTDLLKILSDNEYGAISHKPRNISLTINGKYMPDPQITLSSTGDGIAGPEIDLDIDGEFFEEQQPCEDCISRDSAIKAMDYDIKSFEFKSGVSRYMDDIAKLLNTIYEIQVNNIKALPSVIPQETKTGHWIPVSERLPEIRQHVLCQCRGNNYSVLRLNHNGDWECIYPHTTYMQSFVIAWMPLPEPYESQESEDKE